MRSSVSSTGDVLLPLLHVEGNGHRANNAVRWQFGLTSRSADNRRRSPAARAPSGACGRTAGRSPGRFASGRTRQLSRELLPAATRRENQELKTDAPSGHGLAAAFGLDEAKKKDRWLKGV